MNEAVDCEVSEFWKKGFVAVQAAINAAIIEVSTKHPRQTRVPGTFTILGASKVS